MHETGHREVDVFLSYSRAADEHFAPALQRSLARLAKPWNKPRALRVFRDRTDLSTAADLTAEIRKALHNSRYFVLLAAPEAAASPWVGKEVEHWIAANPPETLMIAVTGGEIAWKGTDFDWTVTDALPRALSGYFEREPIWEDFRFLGDTDRPTLRDARFRSAVASLAAAPRAMSKDQLDSADARQHRITTRLRSAAVTALVVLLVLATTAGTGFLLQRNDARQQRDLAREQSRIASARLMSVRADNLLATDMRSALLLAVASYRTDPNPETYAALLRANLAAPALRGYLNAGAKVLRIETSGDGRTILAALADGRVVRWSEGDEDLKTIARLNAPATSISLSDDASVIAMSSGSTVLLSHAGTDPAPLEFPGSDVTRAAVSPSGKTMAVAHSKREFAIVDTEAVTVRSSHTGGDSAVEPNVLIATSDDQVFLFNDGYGEGERRAMRDWSKIAEFSFAYGTKERSSALTGNAEFVSATNGDRSVPVWRTDGGRDEGPPDLTAEIPQLYRAGSVVLSHDGSSMAVAQDGDIYIAPVAPPGTPRAEPVRLSGAGTVDSTALLRFFGRSNSALVSAYDNVIAVWNPKQIDRLADGILLPLGAGCSACFAPDVVVAPGKDSVALVAEQTDREDNERVVLVHPLKGIAKPTRGISNLWGIPLWRGTNEVLIVSTRDAGRWPDLPSEIRIFTLENGALAARVRKDAETVATVDNTGRPHIYDIRTKAEQVGFRDAEDLPFDDADIDGAAIDGAGDRAVLRVENLGAWVFDIATGQHIGTVAGADIALVEFSGNHLLIQRADGSLEFWRPDASVMEAKTSSDLGYPRNGRRELIDTDAAGKIVARVKLDGSVALVDGASGNLMALIPSVNPGELGKTGVGLSSDGGYLVTATEGSPLGAKGKMVERDISPDGLISAACEAAAGNLTAEDWRRLIGLTPSEVTMCPK